MTKKKNNELPQWFVYDAQGVLDVRETLNAAPDNPDKESVFFRGVPDWFEAGSGNLDEMRNTLTEMDNMPEKERKRHTPEEIKTMRSAFERMIFCNEMMSAPGLSDNQKEILRCICYWVSLETMNSIPLTPEDAEGLF